MRIVYNAVFAQNDLGKYKVTLPDYESFVVYEEDFLSALKKSISSLKEVIECLIDLGEKIPMPNYKGENAKENELVYPVEIEISDNLYQKYEKIIKK